MIEALLVALVLIGIVALIGWGITAVIPMPPQVKTIVMVIVGVICLVILLRALTGGALLSLH